LFDLDGTLLDSAPDFVATANRMRAARALPAITLEQLRPQVSKGSRAMLAVAFPEWAPADRESLVPEFLAVYLEELGRHSHLFDGVADMLAALEADGAVWGIVTNKPEYLAREILPQLGWQQRCAVLVGGDTLAEKKPHPLPLLVAAEQIGFDPAACVYVGDDERDIVAARAAGMPSVAALWGYRLHDDTPDSWQADVMHDGAAALCRADGWPATAV
jgi:phosphoglycolate phosphatase